MGRLHYGCDRQLRLRHENQYYDDPKQPILYQSVHYFNIPMWKGVFLEMFIAFSDSKHYNNTDVLLITEVMNEVFDKL